MEPPLFLSFCVAATRRIQTTMETSINPCCANSIRASSVLHPCLYDPVPTPLFGVAPAPSPVHPNR